jgi:hypothetical protein
MVATTLSEAGVGGRRPPHVGVAQSGAPRASRAVKRRCSGIWLGRLTALATELLTTHALTH